MTNLKSTLSSVLIAIVVLASSCNAPLTKSELGVYLQDESNGVKKTFKQGGFKVDVIYRPTDLIVSQEAGLGKTSIDELKSKYDQYHYFVMNLQNNGRDLLNSTAANGALFASINKQLSFNLNKHVYLVDGNKDTINMVDFNFPRLYEASRATTVLMVFKADEINTDDFKMIIDNIAYTSTNIKFDFNKKDLANIPSLKI